MLLLLLPSFPFPFCPCPFGFGLLSPKTSSGRSQFSISCSQSISPLSILSRSAKSSALGIPPEFLAMLNGVIIYEGQDDAKRAVCNERKPWTVAVKQQVYSTPHENSSTFQAMGKNTLTDNHCNEKKPSKHRFKPDQAHTPLSSETKLRLQVFTCLSTGWTRFGLPKKG